MRELVADSGRAAQDLRRSQASERLARLNDREREIAVTVSHNNRVQIALLT